MKNLQDVALWRESPLHPRLPVGLFLDKNLFRSLDSWTAWLSHAPQEVRMKLRRAILAQDIPQHILHHFACDCLEHAISLCEILGDSLSFSCQPAIEAKRQWIERGLAWSDLEQTHLGELRRALMIGRHEIPANLAKKINSLFRQEAHLAVLDCVESRSVAGEIEWQHAHLIAMLQRYRQLLEQLYRLLRSRRQLLHPHVDYWKQQWEMVLFVEG